MGITEISLPNIFIFRSKMSTSESTSDISPYVSLGRLRFVQKLLDANKKDKNQSSFDAIFCATGEDSDYNDGCQDLVNFLLLDVFQVDLKTAPEDEIDEDFMMAIKPNQVHIYCNPSNYGKLIDRGGSDGGHREASGIDE